MRGEDGGELASAAWAASVTETGCETVLCSSSGDVGEMSFECARLLARDREAARIVDVSEAAAYDGWRDRGSGEEGVEVPSSRCFWTCSKLEGGLPPGADDVDATLCIAPGTPLPSMTADARLPYRIVSDVLRKASSTSSGPRTDSSSVSSKSSSSVELFSSPDGV